MVLVLADAKLHERFELADPVRLEGVTVQAVLFDARLTTPANPFRLVTVMVEVPTDPALTVTEVGFAATEKS
jgi:hypothetical protein